MRILVAAPLVGQLCCCHRAHRRRPQVIGLARSDGSADAIVAGAEVLRGDVKYADSAVTAVQAFVPPVGRTG